jgi:osmotically inducible protein OsmC
MKRSANANWKGSGKEGKGTVTADSGIFSGTPISWRTRFQDVEGTSPEELAAAAHAGCYSMKLSFVLGAAGFTPDNIDTRCTITLDNGAITESHLEVKASVPGIDEAKFQECVEDAKKNCPISKLYSTTITAEARLEQTVNA